MVTTTTSAAPTHEGDLTWREQKKRLTRQALHEAARELVVERGLNAVTVEEICVAASVSPRTFFNYFPSKAAAALGLPDVQVLEEARREEFLASSGNVVQDLCALLGSAFEATGEQVSDKAAKQEIIRRRPELQLELSHWMLNLRTAVLELVQHRLPAHSAAQAVTLVFGALHGVIERGDGSSDSLATRLWDAVVEMCELAVGDGFVVGSDQRR